MALNPSFCGPRLTALAMCLLLLPLAGCKSGTAPDAALDAASEVPALSQGAAMPVRPVTPVFQTRTPLYPAIAVYIVYREYVNRNPGITMLNLDDPHYQRYMENRMRELYPGRGYSGMMRDAVAEMRQKRAAWEWYERELGKYRGWTASPPAQSGFTALAGCGTATADPHAG